MAATVLEVLKNNNLSVTDTRIKILEYFLGSNGALSQGELEKLCGKSFDRVTIYRTLQVFLDKGIIHSIPSLENTTLYAICKDECSEGKHFDNHAHFICSVCGKAYCLDEVVIPNVKLPKGFVAVQRDLILNGKCSNCQQAAQVKN